MTLAQGEYPAFLLKSWDSYAKTHVVENDRPGMCVCVCLACVCVCVCVVANVFLLLYFTCWQLPPDSFPAEQLYVVMAAENAGSAVENYQVTVDGGFVIILFGGLSSSLLSSHQWRKQSVLWVKWQGLWP